MQIKVAITDDHLLMINDIKTMLAPHAHVTIVYDTTDPAGEMPAPADTQPHMLLLDIQMPGMDGIALCRHLLNEVLTSYKRNSYEIPLTRREKEILKLIAEEHSNQEIADMLYISLRTVEAHRLNLTQKLAVKNTAGLVKEAIRRGLLD